MGHIVDGVVCACVIVSLLDQLEILSRVCNFKYYISLKKHVYFLGYVNRVVLADHNIFTIPFYNLIHISFPFTEY